MNIGITASRGGLFPRIDLAVAAGFVGFIGCGLSLALFVRALRHVGAARTGAYFSLAPFVGAVISLPCIIGIGIE